MNNNHIHKIDKDIEAVVTSYNQGDMVLEAVRSLCHQTLLPARILIVDDGSTDGYSVNLLKSIESDSELPVPVVLLRQPNKGVSAARNTGIHCTRTSMVLVLDGDDRLNPAYIEQVSHLLHNNIAMVAASSWMQTFGILTAVVRPSGGDVIPFLAKNCCPATHILRRESWEKCDGYDESMQSGFEDWDFFLSILETSREANIGIVESPLLEYRTMPDSSNVKSMTKRLELMRFIIGKHHATYRKYMEDAILGIEETSISRLCAWENEILHTADLKQNLSNRSNEFMEHPSYGDGGMAAAVRIATKRNNTSFS